MLSRFQAICLLLSIGPRVIAQSPGYQEFTAAYHALAQKDYDSAIDHFRAGLTKEQGSAGIHKDLGYTLLKTGENTAARDEFEAALAVNRQDEQAALEYAFLAYETGKPLEARRTFERLRKTASPETKKTAEQALARPESPNDPSPFTAHGELAVPIAASQAPDSNVWSKILESVGVAFPSCSFQFVQADTPEAEQLGIHSEATAIIIHQISDIHNPNMEITWAQPAAVHLTKLPVGFRVFAREKSTDAPVLAGKRTDRGGILWVAAPPGEKGFERYPYLIQALVDLGLPLPARSPNLSTFFDSAYRSRADVGYLAHRWREAGISVLHVAGWHNMEPDPAADKYLTNLIEACHRNAILVYAWLELPHVSEKFWADHPDWREKTALGQDAQVGWRKLMNLQNPECSQAAAEGVRSLLERFDWDGVNLADRYFESLEGTSNPGRFTPMNDNVRAEFKEIAEFDAKSLFDPVSTHANAKDLRVFLNFRAVLASRLQSEWLKNLASSRKSKPYLDIVLTLVDGGLNPAAQVHHVNLLNLAERDGEVYPTRKPAGMELLQLLHGAAQSSALYSENLIEKADLPLLGAPASAAHVIRQEANEIEIDSPEAVRIEWQGAAELDGQPWPLRNDRYLLVPAGHHRITACAAAMPLTLTDFNGRIQSATVSKSEVDVAYQSQTRALVTFDQHVASIELDGAPFWKAGEANTPMAAVLPAGQHLATFTRR